MRVRDQMDAAPTGAVTIPSGALAIPLKTERDVLSDIFDVTSIDSCLTNLCQNGAPSAAITSRKLRRDHCTRLNFLITVSAAFDRGFDVLEAVLPFGSPTCGQGVI